MNRTPIFDIVKELRGGKPFTDAEVLALDAAIDAALGDVPAILAIHDAEAFFSALRGVYGAFTQTQVDGCNALLAAMGAARWPISWAAYGLATAWHETAANMQPVREAYWLSEEWRKAHLRYFPWYGRGFVQITWEDNYKRADEELGLNGSLIAKPDMALEPDIAAQILVKGMEEGWFSGKALKDYLPIDGEAGFDAFTRARRIINGTDRADKVAKHAQAFQTALRHGGWA